MKTNFRSVLVIDAAAHAEAPLSNGSYRIETAQNKVEAIQRICRDPVPAMVLVDMRSSEDRGLGILKELRQVRPSVPVIMLFSMSDPQDVVRAVRLGAEDCIVKPADSSGWHVFLEERLRTLPDAEPTDGDDDGIDLLNGNRFFVAVSSAMRTVREQIRQLSNVDVPVLCLGESGTGKEVVARLIHKSSRRADRLFMKINCAALPSELLESELFGYERGAFTGADRAKPGKFELCNHGTILLDEIAEMPTPLQAKLLHVLQDQEFTRLGGRSKIKVNVRVLAATNVEIEKAIVARTFREDLYYRLSTFVFRIPPLRERRDDIPVLLRRYLKFYASLHGLSPRDLTPDVLESCCKYAWPGNVRELENFARRYLILGEPYPGAANDGPMKGPVEALRERTPLGSDSEDLKTHIRGLKDEAETLAIRRALEETKWNRKAAAELLKISYKSLLAKIRQYDLALAVPAGTESTPAVNPSAGQSEGMARRAGVGSSI